MLCSSPMYLLCRAWFQRSLHFLLLLVVSYLQPTLLSYLHRCISYNIMGDPRRIEEQQRRRAGLYRRLGITRTPKPHPSVGGTRGYSVEMRESEIWSYDHGLPVTASASRRSSCCVKRCCVFDVSRWGLGPHPTIPSLFVSFQFFCPELWFLTFCP